MINRYVNRLLIIAASVMLLCGEATATGRFIEELGLKGFRRIGNCFPSFGTDSYKRLMGMNLQHFDKNHKTIKRLSASGTLPSSVDLSAKFLPPFDQGNLGSCTANALVGNFCYAQGANNLPVTMMSRLYLYWQERNIEGTVNSDSGAALSDGILALQKTGVCKESTWPYDASTFTQTPTPQMNAEAANNKDLDLQNTGTVQQDLNIIKTLLNGGAPITIGFNVYASFESDAVTQTGMVPMPGQNEQLMGGHAVVLAGYSDTTNGGSFFARNSWGTNWGATGSSLNGPCRGYFWFPYQYALNSTLTLEFWKISKVSELLLKSKL